MNTLAHLQKLTDNQLTQNLIVWHGRERAAQAEVIAHLLEVERRELHLARGYSSLFAFCTRALGMTEDVAGTRIGAVRVARQFPQVLQMLATGTLYLSSIRLLKPYLTPDNAPNLLQDAARLSKRELEKLLASTFPRPDVTPSVRTLPQTRRPRQIPAISTDETPEVPVSSNNQGEPTNSGERPGNARQTSQVPSREDSRERHHNTITPRSEKRYKVTFTASEKLVAKLEQAKALLSHAIKEQSLEEVIMRALTVLVDKEEKRRFGAPRKKCDRKPAADSPDLANTAARMQAVTALEESDGVGSTASVSCAAPAPTRHIPAAVRRAVYERDGHRCTFRGPDGTRCSETRFVEFDHVHTPFAQGGESTAGNLTLRCTMHNQWAARQVFGRSPVEARIREQNQRRGDTR